MTSALMVLALITTITACSPKPSAEDTAAQNKALVAQAVEEAKKEMIATQAAEKAMQDALAAEQAEAKRQQDAAISKAVSKAKKEMAAEQRAASRDRSYQSTPISSSNQPTQATRNTCSNCGVVLSVKLVETAGQGSGLGVVTGGVVGGLLGNQIGKGSGQDVATVVGVVGGAFAGNQIEKSARKTKVYNITVRMDSGEERIVRQATSPNVSSGDSVKIENDLIVKL